MMQQYKNEESYWSTNIDLQIQIVLMFFHQILFFIFARELKMLNYTKIKTIDLPAQACWQLDFMWNSTSVEPRML